MIPELPDHIKNTPNTIVVHRNDQVIVDGKIISFSEHIVRCILECLRYYPGGEDAKNS